MAAQFPRTHLTLNHHAPTHLPEIMLERCISAATDKSGMVFDKHFLHSDFIL